MFFLFLSCQPFNEKIFVLSRKGFEVSQLVRVGGLVAVEYDCKNKFLIFVSNIFFAVYDLRYYNIAEQK